VIGGIQFVDGIEGIASDPVAPYVTAQPPDLTIARASIGWRDRLSRGEDGQELVSQPGLFQNINFSSIIRGMGHALVRRKNGFWLIRSEINGRIRSRFREERRLLASTDL
jgi:hypothetical protein